MTRPLVLCLLLAAPVASATDRPLFEGLPVPAAPQPVTVDGGLVVGAPVEHGALAIFPVIDPDAREPKAEERLLPLSAALRQGQVQVVDSGIVGQLFVENLGKEPVLAMAGDVFVGGRQDRVLMTDLVLPPESGPVPVAVNCVEQGRWSESALGARFGYGGRAELGLRRVVQVQQDQSATWAAVAEVNGQKAVALAARGIHDPALLPDTGSYLASITSPWVDLQVDKAADLLLEDLDKIDDLVGIVVAFDGEVVASEVYGQPYLFDLVGRDAVEAVARDAVTAGLLDRDPASLSPVLAAAFLGDALHPVVGEDQTVDFALHDASGELLILASYSQ